MSEQTKLPTSPDWPQYPKKWKWFAIDGDGMGVLYTHKPERIINGFGQGLLSANFLEIGRVFDSSNWKNSLQKRPTE